MTFNPDKLTIGPQPSQPSVLRDYIIHVGNQPLMLAYKRAYQYGNKKGEPLYAHLLNGVMLLDALRDPLELTETELRLLMSVFTVHDINKDEEFDGNSFGHIATLQNFAQQIERFNLNVFFPEIEQYVSEITTLARDHGGHSSHHASLVALPSTRISHERLRQLLHLIQAVDIVDLSHSLEERTHKATFLSKINAFADHTQYQLYLHQLSENRGAFSNLIHGAIVRVLQEEGAYPLLYYPDGVVYLVEEAVMLTTAVQTKIARACAQEVNNMTASQFADFVKSGIQGIKVDGKCLEMGLPFGRILNEIATKAEKRSLDRDSLTEKIIDRTTREFEKNKAAMPDAAEAVEQILAEPTHLLPATDRLRLGELIRSYYIFLNDHFSDQLTDAWETVYDLLEIPAATRPALSYFNARYDRPYVLMRDVHLPYDDVYDRLLADGSQRLEANEIEDEKTPLFQEYLGRYALFGVVGQARPWAQKAFTDHLAHYLHNQHKQCAHCSAIFPTDKWMTNDVRSDITVQTFSNRLRGGPGEPKKYVCALCQMQFLVERLNYEEVRGEKTMYLHFFPYSFLPMPYIAALRDDIEQIRGTDTAVRALWCDTRNALLQDKTINPDFLTQTKKGKPHPYGMYMPKVRNTVGNRIILPINPAGDNDSQRFLFALWNALVLQEHLGLKVMLTEAPTAPFIPTSDFYIDNVALSCAGFITRNDYDHFINHERSTKGTLVVLKEQASALHRIQRELLTTSKKDEILALVQAMSGGGLMVMYTAEKLLEAKVRDQSANAPEWAEIRLAQRILPDLETLAHHTGGTFMTQMSTHLQALAEIAWQKGLRGKSLKKNSLMTPIDEIFKKLNQRSQAFDTAALKAVIINDIFEYLERIADEQYKPGKGKQKAITQFVDLFFAEVYEGIYQASLTKLLADEKMIRSAFLFYVRQQIPSKSKTNSADAEDEAN